MKKLGGILLIVALSVVWYLIPGPRSEFTQYSADAKKVEQAPKAKSGPIVSLSSSSSTPLTSNVKVETDNIKREYQEVAYTLAQKIQQSNLDVTLLNEWATTLTHDEFMKKLPRNVREGYAKLEQVILKIRNRHLAEDGMTESFFTKYQVEMPSWLQDRRHELNSYQLPEAVERLVQQKMNESELTDGDVDNILRGCGKRNANCVDKAFAQLIDANHAINNDQLKRIQEYL